MDKSKEIELKGGEFITHKSSCLKNFEGGTFKEGGVLRHGDGLVGVFTMASLASEEGEAEEIVPKKGFNIFAPFVNEVQKLPKKTQTAIVYALGIGLAIVLTLACFYA